MSGGYRDAATNCARCGKLITTEVAVSLPWAPYAFMCGHLGDGRCFEAAEKDLKRLYGAPVTVNKRVINLGMESWGWFAGGVGVFAGVCLLGYMLFMAATVPDRVNACYTYPEAEGSKVRLYGQVDWHDDRTLGLFETFDQAVEGARKIGCPIDVPAATLSK